MRPRRVRIGGVVAWFLLSFAAKPVLADDGAGAKADAEKGTGTIDELKTPTSPAFILIGASPTRVERPSTPQDVAVTIYNAVKSASGLPKDFAIEIAPYWLWSHPTLKYQAYMNASILKQLAYNGTLSAATVTSEAVAPAVGSTDLAFGLRTQFFFNLATKEQNDTIAKREQALGQLQMARLRARALESANEESAKLECDKNPQTDKCREVAARLQQLAGADKKLADVETSLRDAATELQKAIDDRSGVVTSLAFAMAGRTPAGEKVGWKEPTKEAGWLNLGYRLAPVDFLGVGRFTHVSQAGSTSYLDAGARLVLTTDRFNLSGEVLRRFVLSQPAGGTLESSTRITGTVEVKIGGVAYLSATLGQDVASETQPAAFISVVGLGFQTSRERRFSL